MTTLDAFAPIRHVYRKTYGSGSTDVSIIESAAVLIYFMEGYVPRDQAYACIDDLVDTVAAERPRGVITDVREMKVLHADFQKAIRHRLLTRFAELGVVRNPGIVPEAVLTKSSVTRMVNQAGEVITTASGAKMEITIVGSIQEALDWIAAA